MMQLKVEYKGQYTYYYCPVCDAKLALVHDSGTGVVFSPCSHVEIGEFGNLYYEMMARKLNRNAILRVFSGETVYIIYPKSQ